MDRAQTERFRTRLQQQRRTLLHEMAEFEGDLALIAETRESEFEEAAQEERRARVLARLDDRGKAELEAIDGALARLNAGQYGVCVRCGEPIALERLRAVPSTPYCRACAEAVEHSAPPTASAGARPGRVPPDYSLLSNGELETAIVDHVAADERVDIDELRVTCRRGIVHLHGSVPSESEHQILLRTLTDIMGLTEIVDHLEVKEILWEREDRSKEDQTPEAKAWEEPYAASEDVQQSEEEGVDYEPPSRPVPDEE